MGWERSSQGGVGWVWLFGGVSRGRKYHHGSIRVGLWRQQCVKQGRTYRVLDFFGVRPRRVGEYTACRSYFRDLHRVSTVGRGLGSGDVQFEIERIQPISSFLNLQNS